MIDLYVQLRVSNWVGIVIKAAADNEPGKTKHTDLVGTVDGWAPSSVEGIRKPDVGMFVVAAFSVHSAMAKTAAPAPGARRRPGSGGAPCAGWRSRRIASRVVRRRLRVGLRIGAGGQALDGRRPLREYT
ncbi:MAG: hypothetical protein IRZ07_20925 [Microbispora sp.]|nr:hypothetical protein [Microbispora sp.]